MMNEQEYIKSRLDNQINWYSKESKLNKRWFKSLTIIELASAAMIPLIAGLSSLDSFYQITIGLLGVIVTISAGLIAIGKFQENWIEYRTTAESLRHQKYLFICNCFPYNDNSSLSELVHNVENLISKQNSKWAKHNNDDHANPISPVKSTQ